MENIKHKKLLIAVGIIAFILLLVFIIWNQKLNNITVEGNTYYTDEEIKNLIFSDEKYSHTIYALWKNDFSEKKEIPFIKSYDVTITGLHSAEIVVYEKGIVGYIPYMGTYLYFDVEGYIVETSTEKLPGLLFVDGIDFDYFVLNSQLPVEDDDLFYNTLVLSRIINEQGLDVQRIYFDNDQNITLFMGDINVYLGQGEDLETKMNTLLDIWPEIDGEKGTLYLDKCSKVNNITEYVFKREKDE